MRFRSDRGINELSLAALSFLLWLCVGGGLALAGSAEIEAATAERSADGTWRISANVRHADTGWDHYANAFDVMAPDGTLLKRRELLHPHVNEQPFTRSLSGVEIPDGLDHVLIRAGDSVHGYSGSEFRLDLSQRQ